MTGITDVVKNARRVWRSRLLWSGLLQKYFPEWSKRLLDQSTESLANVTLDPIGAMPMPRLEYFREKPSEDHVNVPFDELTSQKFTVGLKWGILLPICFRGEAKEDCWNRLTRFVASFANTTPSAEQANLMVVVGIDTFDLLYDNDEARERINDLVHQHMPSAGVKFVSLRSSFRGKLCFIWNELAKQALAVGCDFFVLLGDDVVIESANWKAEIEDQFQEIAILNQVPFGFGCVCFRDKAFLVFPTFPVMHRVHMAMFHGELLPREFVNQHGDPYLFELYRRWGSSRFAPAASLCNTIGGAHAARYGKEGVRWCEDLLSKSIQQVEQRLARSPSHACWNIVVPSFRCKVEILSTICKLSLCVAKASVHVLIVVDNPHCDSESELLELQDWSPNHLVRIWKQPRNLGASLSRNTGMAQSFGDWCVLLDDDVIPQADLLDEYYAVSKQFPAAKILIGNTLLPKPSTTLERALVVSGITYFYNIAEKAANPPWGVTANMCVQGRTSNIWFSNAYPKTGGGEDVDFCIRTKNALPNYLRDTVIVAAPKAKVVHPFWKNIFSQVVGWAKGDTFCLTAMPHSTFYAPPNWTEWIAALSLLWAWRGSLNGRHGLMLLSVFTLECIFNFLNVYPGTKNLQTDSGVMRVVIASLAIIPSMLQDAVRLAVKLSQGRIYQLGVLFDWMDGQKDHVAATTFSLLIKNIVFSLTLASFSTDWKVTASSATAIVLILPVWSYFLLWNEHAYVLDCVRDIQPLLSSAKEKADSLLGQPFVVLAHQGTGSNYLCGRLQEHAQLLMHSEIFNEQKIYLYSKNDVTLSEDWHWDVFSRNKDPSRFLRDVFTRLPYRLDTFKLAHKAVGFTLFPEHWRGVNEHVFRRLVADRSVKKIILKRQSLLEVYASSMKADQTGNSMGKSLDGEKIVINPPAFRCFIDNYNKCYEYYDTLCAGQGPSSVLRVSYEDMIQSAEGAQDQCFSELLDFLGVDEKGIPSPLKETVRQSSPKLSSTTVVNHDEIVTIFGDDLFAK